MAGRNGSNKHKKKKEGASSAAPIHKKTKVTSDKRMFDSASSQRSYHSLIQKLLAVLVGFVAVRVPWGDILGSRSSATKDDLKKDVRSSASSSTRKSQSETLHSCKFYMARSNIPGGGWGIFTKAAIPQHDPVLPPELIIQVPDIAKTEASGLHRILNDYMWSAAVTGGQFEGITATFSVMPGLGMLANGHLTSFDVVPDQARRHPVTKSLERHVSPLAGSMTQYHSMQYYAYHDIPAGSEIFINYGTDWKEKISDDEPPKLVESPDRFEEDFCLDRLRPGITKEHGYGAVLKHAVNAGDVLLPLPVLPLHRASVEGRLLMNYCYGHQDSELVLYPYSPMSNYINHDGVRPNARLQWRSNDFPSIETMLREQPAGLSLELVAIRTIESGEQVTIDYGREWEAAWSEHLERWNATMKDSSEVLTYVYPDDPLLTIRTETEQREQPYASNIQTVCYRYEGGVVPSRLHKSRLEACRVLKRTTKDDFLVEFRSDAVQTRIDAKFITFTDKPGTSDQAMDFAFRHVIGMDEIFPSKWLRAPSL